MSASCLDEYVFLDRISWDNFNESCDLKTQIENRIMNKLAHTSETAIAITFLVMNLSVILRRIFRPIFLFNYFFRVIDYQNLSVNS
ncbi:hypothetical protein PL9214650529 [Planktothrix tepida PCC 9214]|uniref:Transposase DDE domain-containing protein n=1 Tax=Planktothrix tepida PCC 9214 TaxID=671072 RepID=A0A1J1LSW3_9CYAN|nr:hypothetical protein PL9214650529 [Planktothrix tepida PCC 9214]